MKNKTDKKTPGVIVNPSVTNMSPAQLAESNKQAGLLAAKAATEKLQNQQAGELKKLGREIIAGTAMVGEKYLNLCQYIRKNMVAPKLVSFELGELGFHRVAISKINKVANASDELWNEFSARNIGFNKMLEMSRGELPAAISKASGNNETDVRAQIAEMAEEEEAEAKPLIEPTSEEKKEKFEAALTNAAARALSAAASLELKRDKKIVGGNGYILTISRDKNWKPSSIPVETITSTIVK